RPAPSWSPEVSPATRAIRGARLLIVARSSQQGALAALDEFQQLAHVVAVAGQLGQLRARFLEPGAGHVQGAVGALDRGQALGVETAALEALDVDAARLAVALLRDEHVGRHVAVDESTHADEGMRADAAELVHSGEAAADHLLADLHV